MSENAPEAQGTGATESATPTSEEKIKGVLKKIRPFLQQDGGDVEFVGFADGVVTVRLQGACSSCPSSTYTLKMGIESALKQQVPEVQEVVQAQ